MNRSDVEFEGGGQRVERDRVVDAGEREKVSSKRLLLDLPRDHAEDIGTLTREDKRRRKPDLKSVESCIIDYYS